MDKRIVSMLAAGAVLLLIMTVPSAAQVTPPQPLPAERAGSPTYKGVQPTAYPGNLDALLSGTDDQPCYALVAWGWIGDWTGEIRGFKVDPPVGITEGPLQTTISDDLKYLSWMAQDNVKVLGFVVKGGPNFNVYDYVPYSYSYDQSLHSPLQIVGQAPRRLVLPQISHYSVCYAIIGGTEGCTPGYWRNHYDRWFGYSADQVFDAVFGVTYLGDSVTLGMAIGNPQTYGAFAFHAVAALLNAASSEVSYPYTEDQVKSMVQAAVASGNTETTKNDSPALRFPWTLICDKENQDVQHETLGIRVRARSPEGD